VFAGADEADNNLAQGEDALWSHRAYVHRDDQGKVGPPANPLGGTQLGDTGLWVGDFTMQPENGGLGTIAHEYAHDLDLPDDLDGSGISQNSTGYWTLMGQPRLSAPGDGGWDTRAGDLGAWNKLQLGWLDHETAVAGRTRTLDLGPEEYNSTKAQAVVVVLPRKRYVTGGPYAGAKQFFSGNADNLDTSLTRTLDLTGRTSAALTFKARYAVEAGWDYLYVEASTDGGTTWTALPGTVGGVAYRADDFGQPAIDGTTDDSWVDVAVPLDAYVGAKPLVRLHYRTDGGVSEGGFYADDLRVVADGRTLSTDGAEAARPSWTATGFTVVGPKTVREFDHFYIAANRTHVSYDRYLKTGPSYSGYAGTRPRYVDHYPYSEGLLISYWDTEQADNDTSNHIGAGRNLYIDAHPEPLYNLTGKPWHNRLQTYDAPFSLARAASFTIHVAGAANYVRAQPAVSTFDDTDSYLDDDIASNGVRLPAVGVQIRILRQNGTSMKIKIS
jgi:immune inhibitor A